MAGRGGKVLKMNERARVKVRKRYMEGQGDRETD